MKEIKKIYSPDRWHIIGTDDAEVWKVLGGWSGGYLDPDYWRLSSGLVIIEEEGDYWLMRNHSGSTYKCHKETQGFNATSGSIYQGWKNQLKEKDMGELKTYTIEEWKRKWET